jgi:hypothetical protein
MGGLRGPSGATLQHIVDAIEAQGGSSGTLTQVNARLDRILQAVGPLEDFPVGYTVRELLYRIAEALQPVPAPGQQRRTARVPPGHCPDFDPTRYIQVQSWHGKFIPEQLITVYVAEMYPPIGGIPLTLVQQPSQWENYGPWGAMVLTTTMTDFCIVASYPDDIHPPVALSENSIIDGGTAYGWDIGVGLEGGLVIGTQVMFKPGPDVGYQLSIVVNNTTGVDNMPMDVWVIGRGNGAS